ncbi:MAG: hypothetical protein AAGI48_05515 [Verrucomicrobiota bacterium]
MPLGICSWDFELRGGGREARLGYGWPTESGWINIDGHSHEVRKRSFLGGEWQMLDGDRVVFEASKRNPFTRCFDLRGSSGGYVLEADSFACRNMTLSGSDAAMTIETAHLFTRRATIRGRMLDFDLAVFAFWLAALTWRRAANNSSSSGAT